MFGLKILKLVDADPDPASGIFLALDPGSRMEKFGFWIRDKHSGSATPVITSDVALLNMNLKGERCCRQLTEQNLQR